MLNLTRYIAACPHVPNVACQACDEESEYNRVLICYKCFAAGAPPVLAEETTHNAWAISNINSMAKGNNHSNCNGFIFCTDCIHTLGIIGLCNNHSVIVGSP